MITTPHLDLPLLELKQLYSSPKPTLVPGSGPCQRSLERSFDIPSGVVGFLGGSVVKNLPVMQEIWVPSLDWQDSLEKGMATHSSVLAWGNPMDGGAWQAIVHGVKKELHRI